MLNIVNTKSNKYLDKVKNFKNLLIIGNSGSGKTYFIKKLLANVGDNPLIIFPYYHGIDNLNMINKDLDIYYHSKRMFLSEVDKKEIIKKIENGLKNNQDIIIDEIDIEFKSELINLFSKNKNNNSSKLIITSQNLEDFNNFQEFFDFDKILIGKLNNNYSKNTINKLLKSKILNNCKLSEIKRGDFIFISNDNY